MKYHTPSNPSSILCWDAHGGEAAAAAPAPTPATLHLSSGVGETSFDLMAQLDESLECVLFDRKLAEMTFKLLYWFPPINMRY